MDRVILGIINHRMDEELGGETPIGWARSSESDGLWLCTPDQCMNYPEQGCIVTVPLSLSSPQSSRR